MLPKVHISKKISIGLKRAFKSAKMTTSEYLKVVPIRRVILILDIKQKETIHFVLVLIALISELISDGLNGGI